MRTLLLLGVLTVWVALPGVAAAYLSVGEPAPFFSVESGDDENLTLDMLRGKVIILFYETREVVRKNREFKDYLKSLYNGLPEAVQGKCLQIGGDQLFGCVLRDQAHLENEVKGSLRETGDDHLRRLDRRHA